MQLSEWRSRRDLHVQRIPSSCLGRAGNGATSWVALFVTKRRGVRKDGMEWRIKRHPSARTYLVSVMREVETNTAEKRVVTRAAMIWKSPVNAIIRRVHSHFGSLFQAVPLTWPTNSGSGGARP